MSNDLSEEIKRAKENQITKIYTDAEAEKLRQKAAKVFERYESDMTKKMTAREQDYIREHYLYS